MEPAPCLPEPVRAELELWRAVEAQHVVSTNVLVDTLAEQAQLERLLEESKPPAPPRPSLHWLLSTPFRYPPLAGGSRFRGPADAGVWYGAEAVRTACAEVGYWRWRFLLASPALSGLAARAQTLFRVPVAGRALDLRVPPLVAERERLTRAHDYGPTQSLARRARAAGVELLRYESVRDPEHGGAAVLFTPAAFAATAPLELQTWLLEVQRTRVTWVYASTVVPAAHEFSWSPGA